MVDVCCQLRCSYLPSLRSSINNSISAFVRLRTGAARVSQRRGIREADTTRKRKTEDHFSSNNLWQVWPGGQNITNYWYTLTAADGDASLAEELNCCFSRFGGGTPAAAAAARRVHSPAPSRHLLEKTLHVVSPGKAAGPDRATGRDCAQ